MKAARSRGLVFLFTVAALILLGLPAGRAAADKALFRMQGTGLIYPFPPVTPGGAGRSIYPLSPYLRPYSGVTSKGDPVPTSYFTQTTEPPGVATVAPGNPIGSPFTLPRSVFSYQGTFTLFPSTAFTGYLSRTIETFVNLEGRFRPNNPYGVQGSDPVTVTIHYNGNYPAPTNPNAGPYDAVTNTHGGLFGFSRYGYMKIEPGPNHFGGTMRILYDPSSLYYQYVSYFNPLFFKAYGSFNCTKNGAACTSNLETTVGEVTSSGMVTNYLLSPTVFTYPTPTENGKTQYRKIASPPAVSKSYWLHLNAPYTTGMVSVYGALDPYPVHPVSTGYDISLGGTDITLTRTATTVSYKGAGQTFYFTRKYYTKLPGVTRVVSLVKPRITHTYLVPRVASDPITSNYQANRVAIMKVFFMPEPGALLLIGSGLAGLAGLSLLRRR